MGAIMAALTVQPIVQTGLAVSYASAGGSGDTIAIADSNQRNFIIVKNTSGSPVTVTVTRQNTTGRVAAEGNVTLFNLSVSVPATTGERLIGPLTNSFIDSSGNVNVSYSATSSVTVAAISLPALA